MGINVYFRDSELQRVGGEVIGWSQLQVEQVWAGVGTWSFTLPANHPRIPLGYGTRAGVVINMDGKLLMSGPVRNRSRESKGDSDQITFSGPDDSVWLFDRRAEPEAGVDAATVFPSKIAALNTQITVYQGELTSLNKIDLRITMLDDWTASMEAQQDAIDARIAAGGLPSTEVDNLNAEKASLEHTITLVANMKADLVANQTTRDARKAELNSLIADAEARIAAMGSGSTVTTPGGNLAYRVAYSTTTYDRQQGNTESVIKHYVNAALGTAANPERRLNRFVIAIDRARGPVISHQVRFPRLLGELQKLATGAGNFGFGIKQVAEQLVFEIELPRNRRAFMQFRRDWGTLGEFTYADGAAEANEFLIGDEEKRLERAFIEGRNDGSIAEWGRIESELRDRGDTSEMLQLYQSLDEDIAKSSNEIAISLVALETEARQFGRDWQLGDYVTVKIPIGPEEPTQQYVSFSELVRSVKLSWQGAQSAAKIEPVISTPDAPHPEVLKIIRRQKELEARMLRVETR